MDIQDWGAIGEIGGALATIGTMLYLALQIRANTRVSRQQALTDTISRIVQWQTRIASSEENLSCWQQGLISFNDLEVERQILFSSLVTEILASFEATFEAAKNGGVKPETIEATYGGIAQLFRNRGVREYWIQSPFSEDFRIAVDNYLETNARIPTDAPGIVPFYMGPSHVEDSVDQD